MGILISAAAVSRCRQCGTRDKGGITCIQALQCNRGEPAAARKKPQGGITIKTIIEVAAGSQTGS